MLQESSRPVTAHGNWRCKNRDHVHLAKEMYGSGFF